MDFYFVMMCNTALLDDFGDVQGLFSDIPWCICSILDWLRCIIAVLDLLAQPHSSIPYVQIGLIIVLYESTLLSSDMVDLCPMIQCK
jgi:hypothetical protein